MKAAILTAAFLLSLLPGTALGEEAQTGRALMDAGIAHLKAGEPEKAALRFQEAVHLMPNNPDGHLQLGFSLQKLGKFREAIASYQGALSLNARHRYAPEAYFNMGVSSDELGEGENALGYMKKSLQAYTDRADYGGVYRVGRYIEHLTLKYPEPSATDR
ncbi:MAG: tetratricopeptide repeat protein [Nitrospinaceae bacterium]|jgi:Flp pilus assembly protein TadD|nr:MAG: tetratricopeptide repeat protein [Nitrospinaceae bacterium]